MKQPTFWEIMWPLLVNFVNKVGSKIYLNHDVLFCLGEFIIYWGEYDWHVKNAKYKTENVNCFKLDECRRKIQERLV